MNIKSMNAGLKRTALQSLLPVAMALSCVLCLSPVSAADNPSGAIKPDRTRTPNIVVILTDDQGYADVGFNGSKDIPTPNIDRIAREGARFDRGYVSFPVCGPSRAGLLTGRYQSRFGFDLNPSENPNDPRAGLPLSEKTMAQVMKPAGYVSSIIGKWHLGNHPTLHPLNRGFDEFLGFTNGGHHYFLDQLQDIDPLKVVNEEQQYRSRLVRNRESVKTTGYLTDVLSAEAVDFVQRQRNVPFFLYLAYNAPHVPLEAPAKYTDRFPNIQDPMRKTYAGMVSAVDDGVGTLLNKLDELGLSKDTIVFFLSDNGGPLTRAKNGSINLPLRGGKGDLFEGGVRVPFAMRWPGQVPAGINYPHPVSSLDILATAAGVSAIDMSGNNPIDGVNLVPYLKDATFAAQPHDVLFWRYASTSANEEPVRTATLKGDKKLHRMQQQRLLFDLGSDKGEATNLISKDLESAADLDKRFLGWNSQMNTPRISIFNEWPKAGSPDRDMAGPSKSLDGSGSKGK